MSTGYSAGMRKDRIMILNRKKAQTSDFGIDGNGIEWEECGCVWCDISWTKGMRAQNAGAIDVYGIIAVRMNYDAGKCNCISMRSRVRDNEGITYKASLIRFCRRHTTPTNRETPSSSAHKP